jgi:chorismate mutase
VAIGVVHALDERRPEVVSLHLFDGTAFKAAAYWMQQRVDGFDYISDRKIRQLLAERRAVFNQVSELTNRIKMQARQG